MANTQYSLFHAAGAPTYKPWDHQGYVTPNVEYSEGIRPTGEYMPAPYLPAIRYDKYFEEFKVMSDGNPVSFDSNGRLVPSGYRKEAAAYKTTADASGIAAADAAATIKYSADDVARGIKNAAGVLVTLNEPVVKSYFTTTGSAPFAQNIFVSEPVGTADYDFWPHPGGDGVNPALYQKLNFNLQHRVGFLTDYVLQLPVCVDNAAYAAAPFKGMAAVIAASGTLKPGMFITYDAASNYVATSTSGGYAYSATEAASVIGQVLEVRTDFPRDYLDEVRTRYTELGDLNKMPGTATAGKSHEMFYANAYGMVTINLIHR